MTQSDSDTSNDMSYDDVCAIAWKGCKAHKGTGIVEKELINGRVAEEMTEQRKEVRRARKGSKPDWYGDRDKGSTGHKGKGKNETENT